jgi:hypothetical protein
MTTAQTAAPIPELDAETLHVILAAPGFPTIALLRHASSRGKGGNHG